MTVNRNNFEAYLLDYLEGRLDPLLIADLMVFLAENPEYEKYFQDINDDFPNTGHYEYGHKDNLKKEFADVPEISADNFDEFCIAACEGELCSKDTERLAVYIKEHPGSERELSLYQQLTLHPDKNIVFSGKKQLKKRVLKPSGLVYRYIALSAIAASLAIMVLILSPSGDENAADPELTYGGHPATEQEKPDFAQPASTDQSTQADIEENSKVSVPKTFTAINASVQAISADNQQRESTAKDDELLAAIPRLTRYLENTTEPIPSFRSASPQQTTEEENSPGTADNYLGFIASRMNLWKTAETAISAFNILTESQLSVDRKTDENGKTTALLVETESYKIEGK